jgi:hypothetical protein
LVGKENEIPASLQGLCKRHQAIEHMNNFRIAVWWSRCFKQAAASNVAVVSGSAFGLSAARLVLRIPPVRPNHSFKRTPNSVARQPSSAGPAAHFAHAGWHATLPGSA